MEQNPYQSPEHAESSATEPSQSSQLFFKILAVCLCVLAVNLAKFGARGYTSPPFKEFMLSDPVLFWAMMINTFVLPVLFLFLMGLASWLRSMRLLIYGLLILTPAMVSTVALFVFGLKGTGLLVYVLLPVMLVVVLVDFLKRQGGDALR